MNILPAWFRRSEVDHAETTDVGPPLGRYKLLSVIGRGSAAKVYRAHDTRFERDVAIKVFELEPADNDLVLQEKELRLLASLNHPGIVSLLDAGINTSESGRMRAFLVMELATGKNLRSALAKSPPTPEQVAVFGADLADALSYLHERGVVHRDVSPANVLLTQYGEAGEWHAKFGDFGIALQAGDQAIPEGEATSGTAAYVSPEQIRGSGVGAASDIYSLGLVLLECFTHRLAFPAVPRGAIDARVHTEPPIPTDLPFQWQALISAMTLRDQAERPGATDVCVALRRINERRIGRHQREMA